MKQSDNEYRFMESARLRAQSVASLSPSRCGPALPKYLIMRDEGLPGLDGMWVVVVRNPASRRSDPFVTEFYRSSVAPLLD